MKLLVATLVLLVAATAAAQQNIPSREPSSEARSEDRPRRRTADAQLRRADEMLDLALEALGSEPEASGRDTLSETVSAKAELVARMLIALCMRVACTTADDRDDEE